MKRLVVTDEAPRPQGSYSQAVAVGGTVYVAGQGPFDPNTGEPVGETIEEQTRQTLRNIEAILRACGAGLEDVVRVGAYIESFDLFDGTPEAGGLTAREAQGYLRSLAGMRFRGFDLVEVSPAYDTPGATTGITAANIVFELLALAALAGARVEPAGASA